MVCVCVSVCGLYEFLICYVRACVCVWPVCISDMVCVCVWPVCISDMVCVCVCVCVCVWVACMNF